MKRTTIFLAHETLDFDRDCVAFQAMTDGRPVRCVILIDALVECFGASPDDPLTGFRIARPEIEACARRRIENGAVRDGELLLRCTDCREEVERTDLDSQNLKRSPLDSHDADDAGCG